MTCSKDMVEVLLLLLAYGFLLDCVLKKITTDVGELPSLVRRRALAGLARRRPRARVVVLRAAPRVASSRRPATGGVPGGRL